MVLRVIALSNFAMVAAYIGLRLQLTLSEGSLARGFSKARLPIDHFINAGSRNYREICVRAGQLVPQYRRTQRTLQG